MTQEAPLHQRQHDDRDAIRIVREVPLWGLLSGLAVVVAQAFALYYGQERLSGLVTQQATDIREMRVVVENLRNELGVKNLKDAEHDFQIEALKARLSQIETRGQRR